MRINHNISALQTNVNMRRTGNSLDKAMERLSSGYKINRASDDAAGMAISRKLKTQIAGLERASMNGSDGISVIQTAEGALNEVTSILQRCRELSVQAANDVNTVDDKAAIQKEIDALLDEVDRISESTEFNTKNLLNGDLDNNAYTDNTKVELLYSSDTVQASNPNKGYKMTVTADPEQAKVTGAVLSGTGKIGYSGTLTINDISIEIDENDTMEDCAKSIFEKCDLLKIDYNKDTGEYITRAYGAKQKINIKCDDDDLRGALGLPVSASSDAGTPNAGKDVQVIIDNSDNSDFKDAIASTDGKYVTVKAPNGFEMKLRVEPETVKPGTTGTKINTTVLDAGSMFIQVGANEGQNIEVKLPKIDSETLGIKYANVMSHEGAETAISLFDKAVTMVSSIRARLGAYQNRLEHTIENVDTAALNMTEAMSRIFDADMAEEMTNFTQQNVLQQAGTSILAQANERPQTILSLLNG
ncbi:MAG: flagellin [Lachnospiraceae bacterium]|nr:flagellin [Lachnospiraceae bacterium]